MLVHCAIIVKTTESSQKMMDEMPFIIKGYTHETCKLVVETRNLFLLLYSLLIWYKKYESEGETKKVEGKESMFAQRLR